MHSYLLTICIPTYNRSSFLKGLLENIFLEIEIGGYANDVQILVVDGNSEDNTSEIIEKFIKSGNFRYFRRIKKEGIDKDILKCVELADGIYCWLFSDDDRFTNGAIAYLVDILRREEDLTGCFCNRISYDSRLERKVAEIKGWPGKSIKEDRLFTDKAEYFKYIGMDFGFISSQVVRKSAWQQVVEHEDFGDLYGSYYLMVHIIGRMMDEKFKWLYINRPLVKERTGNDSLLKTTGVMERQIIEHNSFDKIVGRHYDRKSKEFKIFFKKMADRLPRVIANLKSQNINYRTQFRLLELYYSKYNCYYQFWFKVIPMFFLPNKLFTVIKKVYFKYWI